MVQRKLIPQDVVVMYTEQHLTMEQIGKLHGVTRAAVNKVLKKAGIKGIRAQIGIVCAQCGKELSVFRCRWKKADNHYCSSDCYYLSRSNPDYVPWRQGQRLARMIVNQYFKLESAHIVHHIDGNNRNNKIDNLIVFANQSDHLKHHHGGNVKPLWDGKKV